MPVQKISSKVFLECYNRHHGDALKIRTELGISERTFFRRKNENKLSHTVNLDLAVFVKEYLRCNGDIQTTAALLSISERTAYNYKRQALDAGYDLAAKGTEIALNAAPYKPCKKIKRYLLTCAQNNTHVEEKTWDVLKKVAEFYRAEIYVATFTYSHKRTYDVKSNKRVVQEDNWWDKRVEPYIRDTYEHLAPDLVWCGQMNTLPTAKNPLDGWDSYTGPKSGVYPHPKLQMKSVPTPKKDPPKMNYTTGCVTKRNYIHKRAGIHADFHHCFGALLVEVLPSGEWFARQLNVGKDGVVHDLDNKFDWKTGHSKSEISAIVFGDIHVAKLDPEIAVGAFGIRYFTDNIETAKVNPPDFKTSMVGSLKPDYVFLHDVLDFESASHHNRKDPLHMLFLKQTGRNSVLRELAKTAYFVGMVSQCPTKPVIVNSNHDQHLLRWVKEADWRADLENAETLLNLQLACVRAVKTIAAQSGGEGFDLMGSFLKKLNSHCERAQFLKEDESFNLHNIEFGYHGDIGANGARGSFVGFSKMGSKVCVGHSHSAGIYEGVYVAGVSAKLDMGYNKGASSWSQSHILVYPNGKRSIVTMRGRRWKA